jgi:glycine betaine catabolism A
MPEPPPESPPGSPIDVSSARAVLDGGAPLPPAAWSPSVFEWERRHLFEERWIFACHTSELPDAGAQLALTTGKEGVLLARDRSGAVHAWRNICRHRGHELLEAGERATAAAIRCPYHAWVYGLEGDLRATPRFGDPSGFDRSGFPLLNVGMTELAGSIFVDASGDAPPINGTGAAYGEVAEAMGIGAAKVEQTQIRVVERNWKTVVIEHLSAVDGPAHVLASFPDLLARAVDGSVEMIRVQPVDAELTSVEVRQLVNMDGASPHHPIHTPETEDAVRSFEVAVARAYLSID